MDEGRKNTAVKSDNACRIRRTFILAILTIVAVFIAALTINFKLNNRNDLYITRSTVVRESLPEGSVNETGYYTDELNLLIYESELLPGLEKFYKTTGVHPYIYLTGPTGDMRSLPNETEKKEFAESKYNELFNDDAHLLLVVFKDDDYSRFVCWYTSGQQAASVIDTEAGDILIDYLNKYSDEQSLTYEQYFSTVFELTAARIMSVTPYPLLFIVLFVLVGGLVITGLVILISRHIKKIKQEKAKHTEEMLNIPLEKFSDEGDEAEMLARNYDDDPDNDVEL